MNENLKAKLKEKNKSTYALSIHLGVTQQAGDYLVKQMRLSDHYERLKQIADFLECDIEDIID